MSKHNVLGKEGEVIAKNYLEKDHYKILDTNWVYDKAEIDIVAQKANETIFVEVKTRSTSFFGNPEDAVSKKKQTLLSKAADEYLYQKEIYTPIRFDIISIIKSDNQEEVHHIKDAFFNY